MKFLGMLVPFCCACALLSSDVVSGMGRPDPPDNTQIHTEEDANKNLSALLEGIGALVTRISDLEKLIQGLAASTEGLDTRIGSLETAVKTVDGTLQNINNGDYEDLKRNVSATLRNMERLVNPEGKEMEECSRDVERIPPSLIIADPNLRLLLPGNNYSILMGRTGTLYSGGNFTGETETYDLVNTRQLEGCFSLVKSNWKSVDTNGACIRLFYDNYCQKPSLAVYPGSGSSSNFHSKLSQVGSLGPCLQNEFEFSAFLNVSDGSGFLVKKNLTEFKEIPDLVDMDGFQSYYPLSTAVGSPSNPIEHYYRENSNKRIKFLRVHIYTSHLTPDPVTFPMTETDDWKSLDKVEGDEPGYIVPQTLGGPGNETYNIFPQSKSSRKEWKVLTDQITAYIKEETSNSVYWKMTFSYPDESSSRPFGFYYYFYIYRSNRKPNKIMYGFLRN